MRKLAALIVLAACLLTGRNTNAGFVVSFDSDDFGITSVFNDVESFNFSFEVDEPLIAGMTYNDPTLQSVDYSVFGLLPQPTPSMFPAFLLNRTIAGADFYNLSPDATLNFAIAASADLSDGLQINELSGTGTVFEFNARELNQDPGRYHPPIFTLDSDGTGRLVNANNQSTFNNPPPPTGSGELVDVDIAEEYDVALSFDTNLTAVTAVPEPSTMVCVAMFVCGCAWRKHHKRPRMKTKS